MAHPSRDETMPPSRPAPSQPPTHVGALVVPALLLIAAPSFAQQAARREGWSVGLFTSFMHFSAAAVATPERAIGPSRSTAIGASAWRAIGPLRIRLSAEHLSARLEVRNADVTITAAEPSLDRTRLAADALLCLARAGQARVTLGAGPALDLWAPGTDPVRARAGVQGELAIEFHLGGVTVVNAIGGGISASPLERDDLPEGYGARKLRSAGVTLAASLDL
ncbi:MAG TPA: hypothetical protein VFU00_12720 [Gemmatimonadales bacterium]|nr:hypothetical protein [Gemmatimonadales bacterium]